MFARLSAGWTGMIRAKLATWGSVRCARPRSPLGAGVSWPVKVWQLAQEAEKTLRPSASRCNGRCSVSFIEVPQAGRPIALDPRTSAAIARRGHTALELHDVIGVVAVTLITLMIWVATNSHF